MKNLTGRIMDGLEQALDHARGAPAPDLLVHVPAEVDVARIRLTTGLGQEAFARSIGVSLGTLRNWEQKRRMPEGPARVLLAMIERNPKVVEQTLGRAA